MLGKIAKMPFSDEVWFLGKRVRAGGHWVYMLWPETFRPQLELGEGKAGNIPAFD